MKILRNKTGIIFFVHFIENKRYFHLFYRCLCIVICTQEIKKIQISGKIPNQKKKNQTETFVLKN